MTGPGHHLLHLPAADQGRDKLGEQGRSLPTSSGHILLVDDDEAIAQLNKRLLNSLDYRVTALAAFKQQLDDHDLLITDMTIPELTGAGLTHRVLEVCQG